ncbi:inorganic diphosphatase [Pontibacter arcticus]|uniref:inorganic diphosphatase n=1 Tax=Pontibacter arcticus TaxID=2080288 RepID=A0A364RHF6_9BACT|nr:inorganic diphosphatase [Pontibacter arcticus]RAU83695.1 inorganic diphosphatase [Pontibacter arcticus]
MNKIYTSLLFVFTLLTCMGCKTDYAGLPTYSPAKQLQAVIEVSAGKSQVLHYDHQTKTFVPDKLAGQDRVIEFLPYPANFGFIPSTEIDHAGKGLEILVISESAEPGTVMEVIPLAVLQLQTNGELQHIIIAIPARPSEQTVSATDYASFSERYPAIKEILQKWFTNNTPTARTTFVGWKNERFADQEIQRWMKL